MSGKSRLGYINWFVLGWFWFTQEGYKKYLPRACKLAGLLQVPLLRKKKSACLPLLWKITWNLGNKYIVIKGILILKRDIKATWQYKTKLNMLRPKRLALVLEWATRWAKSKTYLRQRLEDKVQGQAVVYAFKRPLFCTCSVYGLCSLFPVCFLNAPMYTCLEDIGGVA